MNVKARKAKRQVNVENQAINLLSKEELSKKIEVVEKELRSYTWRELETNGKFAKNDKLSFITDDMLIVGCDIGSETHYIRAIDVRGRELSPVEHLNSAILQKALRMPRHGCWHLRQKTIRNR